MQDDNGWPDPANPGVPMRPDVDGYHCIQWPKHGAPLRYVEWTASRREWRGWRNSYMAAQYHYLGPAPLPRGYATVPASLLTAAAEQLDNLTTDFAPVVELLRNHAMETPDAG